MTIKYYHKHLSKSYCGRLCLHSQLLTGPSLLAWDHTSLNFLPQRSFAPHFPVFTPLLRQTFPPHARSALPYPPFDHLLASNVEQVREREFHLRADTRGILSGEEVVEWGYRFAKTFEEFPRARTFQIWFKTLDGYVWDKCISKEDPKTGTLNGKVLERDEHGSISKIAHGFYVPHFHLEVFELQLNRLHTRP